MASTLDEVCACLQLLVDNDCSVACASSVISHWLCASPCPDEDLRPVQRALAKATKLKLVDQGVLLNLKMWCSYRKHVARSLEADFTNGKLVWPFKCPATADFAGRRGRCRQQLLGSQQTVQQTDSLTFAGPLGTRFFLSNTGARVYVKQQ